jgi:hypothetical protein
VRWLRFNIHRISKVSPSLSAHISDNCNSLILSRPSFSCQYWTKEYVANGCNNLCECLAHPTSRIFLRRYLKHKRNKYRRTMSRDSSVGTALGYGQDDRGSRVPFPTGVGNFSLHHRVQNGSGAHPASYPMVTRVSFPGGKAAGLWSWPVTSI